MKRSKPEMIKFNRSLMIMVLTHNIIYDRDRNQEDLCTSFHSHTSKRSNESFKIFGWNLKFHPGLPKVIRKLQGIWYITTKQLTQKLTNCGWHFKGQNLHFPHFWNIFKLWRNWQWTFFFWRKFLDYARLHILKTQVFQTRIKFESGNFIFQNT